MAIFLDRIFYRTAGAPLTALPSITGTYPTATVNGWTEIVGAVAEKPKMSLEPDVKSARGDGTERTDSEKAVVEITVKDFSVANYAALRSAFLNTKVDILAFDNEQRTIAYAAQGIVLSIKLDANSGEAPMIVLSGEKKAGAAATNTPFKPLGT